MMSENNAKTQTVSENTNLRLDSNRQGNNYQLTVRGQRIGPWISGLGPVRGFAFSGPGYLDSKFWAGFGPSVR